MNLLKNFQNSVKELRKVRSLAVLAMLLAIHTILSLFVSIQVTESLRISVSFIANVIAGCLYGPIAGFLCGALGDILQFLIKPIGGYFPGWTLNAALAGMIYGIAFYKRLPASGKKWSDIRFLTRTLLAVCLVNLLINAGLGTYWCMVMYGKHFMVYFTSRFVKNLIQAPINTVLIYIVLKAFSAIPDFRKMLS